MNEQQPADIPDIKISLATKNDTNPVLQLLKATGFFRPNEITIAEEVLLSALTASNEYFSYVATICNPATCNSVIGWICFGPTPCTLGTFDIYWLAVSPDRQRNGTGRRLMIFAEQQIRRLSGRMITVDTSGSLRYTPSRKFYESCGYIQQAVIPDFYAPDDAKVIYIKRLC